MIKANEIRIGNLYERKESLANDKIGYINFDESDWYRIGEGIDYLENYDPISLTEEWLLKFGFIFDENKGFDYINDDGEISNIEDNPLWYKNYSQKRFCVYLKKLTCYVSLNCKYVHDLQNCYFIVTGQELELK